ncbi:MAG: hypothetical protein ACI376_02605 [Candidatus Bruticola sp.]
MLSIKVSNLFKMRKLKRLAVIVLLIQVVCLMAACSIPEVNINKKSDDKFIPPPDISRRPFVVANEFLNNVKTKNYKKAYAALSVDAKMKVNFKSFSEGLERYFSMASTKSVYMTRSVGDERVSGKVALIKVYDLKYPNAPPWIWEFEQTRGGWKIRSLDLPPLFIYQAKKAAPQSKPRKGRRSR